jgi:hypothetical protein
MTRGEIVEELARHMARRMDEPGSSRGSWQEKSPAALLSGTLNNLGRLARHFAHADGKGKLEADELVAAGADVCNYVGLLLDRVGVLQRTLELGIARGR